MYFNYKGYSSIELMTVADSNYCFTHDNIGSYGEDCNSNIFKIRSLWTEIKNKQVKIPEEKCLRRTTSPKIIIFFWWEMKHLGLIGIYFDLTVEIT